MTHPDESGDLAPDWENDEVDAPELDDDEEYDRGA